MDSIAQKLGQIAIVGCGKMGEAILSGLVGGAMFDPDSIMVVEPAKDQRDRLNDRYGVLTLADVADVRGADSIIIAVKPQVFADACQAMFESFSFVPRRVISIAAGIPIAAISSYFPQSAAIRVMPNIALQVGAGMSVVCSADGVHAEAELARELFSLMGEAIILQESQLDIVTAISGSGPAYFALLCEELAGFAQSAGLDERSAQLLATQTLYGSARFLELTDSTPKQLRAAVTSPGGTTQAALESFTAAGFAGIVQNAVRSAICRAEELAK